MDRELRVNRRTFMSKSAAMAAGAFALPGASPAAGQGNTPAASGNAGRKRIGCYNYSVEDILDGAYMDALQKQLGVNFILFSPPIKLPEWFLKKNPLGPKTTLCARAHTDDDSGVYKAVEAAHKRGLDFWLYYTGHHYGAESRPIMSETFDGVSFLDLPSAKYSLENMRTSCFTKPIVKELEPSIFAYGAERYGVDSMYVSHYRYANPSYWQNLFGCACSYCREEAATMGYDFALMERAMNKLMTRLRNLDKATVVQAAKTGLTLGDFMAYLGDDNGVIDWMVFRAKTIGTQFKRINGAVRAATNGHAGFVTDTHNPTLSLYVGHNYADFFEGASDAFHPLSWCDTQHVSVVASWAYYLCRHVSGLDEPAAIQAVTRFFGWDELGLPSDRIHHILGMKNPDDKYDSASFYEMFNPKLTVALMTHEWTKLAAVNQGRLPAHPVIKGDVWPEKVARELMDRALDLGLNGYVFQRTDAFIKR